MLSVEEGIGSVEGSGQFSVSRKLLEGAFEIEERVGTEYGENEDDGLTRLMC